MLGSLYVSYKNVDEIIKKLSENMFFETKIKSGNLFRVSRSFDHIKDFDYPHKRPKKGINILSYNSRRT